VRGGLRAFRPSVRPSAHALSSFPRTPQRSPTSNKFANCAARRAAAPRGQRRRVIATLADGLRALATATNLPQDICPRPEICPFPIPDPHPYP